MTGQMLQLACCLQRVEVVWVVQRKQVLFRHSPLKCCTIGCFVEKCMVRNLAHAIVIELFTFYCSHSPDLFGLDQRQHLNIYKDSLVFVHILGGLATRTSVQFSSFILFFVYISYSKKEIKHVW